VQTHRSVQDLCRGISKTTASGEINCLDPGGFIGITTPRRSPSIAATTWHRFWSPPDITIAAGTSIIRQLPMQGISPATGPGTIGIQITGGSVVSIEDCGEYQAVYRNTIVSHNGATGIDLAATSPNNV
jgi:hypothetical protein